MATPPMTTQHLPARPAAVQGARAAVARYARAAGAGEDQLQDIRLVVSEAVTNAVMHAYHSTEPGEVRVSMAVAGGELWVLIADDGAGLQPRRASPGLGLGLSLIARLCSDFSISQSATGGTELSMRFALDSGGNNSAAPRARTNRPGNLRSRSAGRDEQREFGGRSRSRAA